MEKVGIIVLFILSIFSNVNASNIKTHQLDFDLNFGFNLSANEAAAIFTVDTSFTIIKGILLSGRVHAGKETISDVWSTSPFPPPKNSLTEYSFLLGYPLYFKKLHVELLTGLSYVQLKVYNGYPTDEIDFFYKDLSPNMRINFKFPIASNLFVTTGINYTFIENRRPIIGINTSISLSTIKYVKN